ncbi:predicted protein [Botrytis cinerea T4]|uniref:Uncharacterized protein n=1 Tax=Botryotinia fuckeliana (strain T4) TaxID=999810 RepID=G2XZP1_BOTF4|nr:predicted protein [Botrytis cinerea T4]
MADLRGTEPMHGYNSVTCPRSTSAKQQAGINHPSNFTKALTFLALCDVKFKTGNSNSLLIKKRSRRSLHCNFMSTCSMGTSEGYQTRNLWPK